MRKRIIDWIFTLQSQRGILGEKERRLYTYAYGLLLNKIAIYAIIAIVGTITGNWIGMFSFLLPFTILRQYAGGIHLEKPMNCIIFSGFLVFGCGQYLAVASDMLITDFMSANLILNDLDNYYHGKAVEVKVETLYRDIVLYNQRKSMSKSKERKKAERYWQDKIRNMGTAPELIINNQKTGERETFKQLKFFIDEEGKENINEIAKELRVTASTVILTAFGEVINKWSKNSKFSINMSTIRRSARTAS